MSKRNIIVVGASLGGVETVRELIKQLPADLPASVFVVLHRWAHGPSALEQLLSKASALPVQPAADGASVRPGVVYLAPKDRHLVLDGEEVKVLFGPKENHHRPSIDALFRSAATVYGPRAIGVILTGAMSDGASGLAEIKTAGGVTIVQDPEEAICPSMPLSALRRGVVDFTLPLEGIAQRLVELVHEEVKAPAPQPNKQPLCRREDPSALICPDCGGAMREEGENGAARFRCHTGHVFTLESLTDSQAENVEEALWTAVRTLQERAVMQRRLAETTKSPEFLKKAEANERYSSLIERMIEKAMDA